MNWKERLDLGASVVLVVWIIWFLASWADVLVHQFSGNEHGWNCFVILVKICSILS